MIVLLNDGFIGIAESRDAKIGDKITARHGYPKIETREGIFKAKLKYPWDADSIHEVQPIN
jgi:hypothetical protein